MLGGTGRGLPFLVVQWQLLTSMHLHQRLLHMHLYRGHHPPCRYASGQRVRSSPVHIVSSTGVHLASRICRLPYKARLEHRTYDSTEALQVPPTTYRPRRIASSGQSSARTFTSGLLRE
jgi:hypothetical protein